MTRLHLAVLAAASGILIALLFIPPIVGLADQADFARIMHTFKIEYPPDLSKADRYFCYVQTKYIVSSERPPGRSRIPFFSTELLFVGAAALLHSIAFRSSSFDIRLLALVHAVAFLSAVFLILYGTRRLNRRSSIVLGGLVILIFCDVGYLAYFNSFYSESASYIFGLAYIGSTLLLVQAPRRRLWHLSLLTICGAAFVAAKPQNAPLAAAIACFVWFSIRLLEQTAKLWSRACVASACIILLSALMSYARVPDAMREEALYNSIFNELLVHSPTPEADLREIGLSPQLALYAGTLFWDPRRYRSSDLFPGNTNSIRIVSFYISHPRRFLRLAQRGSAAALSNRCPDLGNFERGSGKPCRSLTNSFAIWDKIRYHLNHFWLLGLFFSANLVLPFLMSRGHEQRVRCLFVFQATLSLMAVVAFLSLILAAPDWVLKHH